MIRSEVRMSGRESMCFQKCRVNGRGSIRMVPGPADAAAPTPNEQVLIFQSILGAWPIEPDRFKQYIVKALREGKTHTSWIDINEHHELRVLSFIDSLYANEEFLTDLVRFHKKISYFGAVSSLSQVVLKITSPGI